MMKRKAGVRRLALNCLLVLLMAGLLAGCTSGTDAPASELEESAAAVEEPAPEPEPPAVVNPLTGLPGFNEAAVGKRPVAVVVENQPEARPQWAIDDPEKAPDIILEGEIEGGVTRMLWFFADYTALPQQVGPIRSARPPYVRFSQLFDAIFFHWGMSESAGDYVGANTVFEQDAVDHIDQFYWFGAVTLFDRDYSRNVPLEHTGVLYGADVPSALAARGIRTDLDESRFTVLPFSEDNFTGNKVNIATTLTQAMAAKYAPLGYGRGTACTGMDVTFSSLTDTKHWTYSEEDGEFHTQDFRTDVKRKNLLVLYDTTEYVRKYAYHSTQYCDYLFAGGNGKLAANGEVIDILWSVQDGKLTITDASGGQIGLLPGKTWIGWISSNNGGGVTVATPPEEPAAEETDTEE